MYNFFVVSYDLHLEKDYVKIKKAIEDISVAWIKPLESFYIIKTHLSAVQIRDTLKKSTDSDDSIVVVKTELNQWATCNIKKTLTDKMKEWN